MQRPDWDAAFFLYIGFTLTNSHKAGNSYTDNTHMVDSLHMADTLRNCRHSHMAETRCR